MSDIKQLLDSEVGGIKVFDLSWALILSWLLFSFKKVFQYRKIILNGLPNAFKLRKHLQWKYSDKYTSQWNYCNRLFEILSTFTKLNVKKVKYLSENPEKPLLDFAEENNYFTIETENDQNFAMEEKNVDYFIEKEVAKALLKRSEDDISYREFTTNLTKQLSTIAKKAILHHNPEFKKSFENLKDQDLLFSNQEVDKIAITKAFQIMFKCKK